MTDQAEVCGICGVPQGDDLFSAVTQEPVCSVCKINFNFLPPHPNIEVWIAQARAYAGLEAGEYLKQDRAQEARRILGRC